MGGVQVELDDRRGDEVRDDATPTYRLVDGVVARKVLAVCEPVLSGLGYDCVHLEVVGGRGKSTVRVFIDQPGGVTISDCASASRELGVVLDVEDVIEGAYVLEVSSPGLDRPLGRLEDFLQYAGQEARVQLRAQADGRKAFTGTIVDVEDDTVIMLVDGQETRMPAASIRKANIKYKFDDAATEKAQR